MSIGSETENMPRRIRASAERVLRIDGFTVFLWPMDMLNVFKAIEVLFAVIEDHLDTRECHGGLGGMEGEFVARKSRTGFPVRR